MNIIYFTVLFYKNIINILLKINDFNESIKIYKGVIYMDVNYKTFTASDGAELQYCDLGKGKPMVFVHPFGGSIEKSLPLILEETAKKFRVICFDQRGFGKSPAYGTMSVNQSARDLKELLNFLGLHKLYAVGYSMGSAVLYSYVEQFGCDSFEKIILGDMTPKLVNEDGWDKGLYQGWYTRERYEIDKATMKKDFRTWGLYFYEQALNLHNHEQVRDFKVTPELMPMISKLMGITEEMTETIFNIDEEAKNIQIAYWNSMCDNDFREVLKKVTCPAAILYSEPGSLYDARTANYVASKMPQAKVYPMMGCTHVTGQINLGKRVVEILTQE